MICSVCNKNTAVVFLNKIENGKKTVEGLCYNCAKEKGINPLEVLAKQANLTEEDLNDMSKQFEDLFGDIAENLNTENINAQDIDKDGKLSLGSIMSNMFTSNNSNNNSDTASDKRKIKVEKKVKEKDNKKNFLVTYGTNLTVKTKNNKLDMVVGREKEIQRII